MLEIASEHWSALLITSAVAGSLIGDDDAPAPVPGMLLRAPKTLSVSALGWQFMLDEYSGNGAEPLDTPKVHLHHSRNARSPYETPT